ncbi:methyltransferase family protein [Cricetibacter osteomyelitidis]|uniref:Methyltransferase family protein n=1 Tax=Cricetibacter osteomyelitidis TaxID=1521931 RepID=A0A4R2T1X7_9PAST|nr:class I SAM-dependent methyltransferase [Cricetibacter osteomyelitidis]TCP95371.1 methyltransferase family protein [Cricetibacter osteomyelitidis]
MIINNIDFGELYRNHIQLATREPKRPEDWDKKAEQMLNSEFDLNNDYVQDFLSRMMFGNDDTVLDVGCGGGAIGLALADKVKQVYALDYSPKMLEVVQQRAERLGIQNITTILNSWDENWEHIPECDICVASRSTMVNDIEDAIYKLNSKARKAVYLTMTVDKDFISQDILRYIGRDSVGFPSYIYAVNILHQQGYRATVNFMDTHSCMTPAPQKVDVQDFIRSVQWSIGELNNKEIALLQQYFTKHQNNLIVRPPQRIWAFVSWQK